MKYLKTFENLESFYLNNKIDNLRRYGANHNDPSLIKDNNKLPINAKFKLGDLIRVKEKEYENIIYELKYYYLVTNTRLFACFIKILGKYSFSTGIPYSTWISENNIEKLTNKEREEYELERDTKKYNL
jgi:hypothetical protein